MKKLLFIFSACCALVGLLAINGCKNNDDPININVRTHNVTVNWFRDAGTPNPAAFIDFYNGAAYTEANAVAHAGSVDAFCFDHGPLPVSFQQVDFVNMANFGNSNFAAHDTFDAVVGILPFSTYTPSTFYQVNMTPTEFSSIRYNSDIASLFSSKGLNGGYADMFIAASDLGNTLKYYQFVCANGRRGFFHVTSANYLPGSTMTIEVRVEQ